MIVTEVVELSDIQFVHTYSDEGYRIRQDGTGDIYDDAIDPVGANRTYTETDIPLDDDTETIDSIIAEVKNDEI